jgi:putative SOS response-associated peptidase YedK
MCGRFTLTKRSDLIMERFKADLPGILRAIYNASPSQFLPVITNEKPDIIQFYQWGLVPHWSKDKSNSRRLINARSETVHQKPAFRKSLHTRRCLVIADGFYEWKKTATGKQPYRITLKNEELFAFAGLWDTWKTDEGETLHSFTILTTQPNELMAGIHDRMPVILRQEDEQKWLDQSLPGEFLQSLLKPADAGTMQAYPVSKLVNSVVYNDERLIKPDPGDSQQQLF